MVQTNLGLNEWEPDDDADDDVDAGEDCILHVDVAPGGVHDGVHADVDDGNEADGDIRIIGINCNISRSDMNTADLSSAKCRTPSSSA